MLFDCTITQVHALVIMWLSNCLAITPKDIPNLKCVTVLPFQCFFDHTTLLSMNTLSALIAFTRHRERLSSSQRFCFKPIGNFLKTKLLQYVLLHFDGFLNCKMARATLHWKKKIEVNLTQNGYLSCRIYTTSHFYHSVGLEPLCTQSSNMAWIFA